jgi:beta-galactosidase
LFAQPYNPPTTHRADINLDAGWRFIRQDVPGAGNVSFDDSSWSQLNLPHTWNNLDGEDGGNDYYRGIGWYRVHYAIDNSFNGRRFFLKFEGAFSVADVWLNGNHLGQHQGGFGAFVVDASTYANVGADNVIAVKVNNAFNTNIPPLTADFTFFGGLYRDVHLLVTDPVNISPLDYGSSGIYLKTTNVSSNSASLQIVSVVSNSTAASKTVVVRSILTDASTNIVMVLTNSALVPPGSVSNLTTAAVIPSPHLWDGLPDPYLYSAYIELWDGTNLVDSVVQPLGFRSVTIDPTNGFLLNGHPLDLHGVSMHQDWLDRGWAIGDAERLTNFALLKELGATVVRLSHYEHSDHAYQLADKTGIVLWSEIPLINYITESPAFYDSAKQQLIELIRQRFNHPAVVCWGIFNEVTLSSGPSPTNLVNQLAQLAKQEDSTRLTTCASAAGDSDPSNWYSDVTSFNKYYGWYSGTVSNFGPWADNIHTTYPARRVGVSEYGAGASVWQHSEHPVQPVTGGPYHPEEYQNLFHESLWQQIKSRPFLWCKIVWNMFDFAVDSRNEGDTPGRNDKGLVTYDRQIRKDAFFWYKANWTSDPMVYITGHTFTNRLTNSIAAKVYANCDSVELILNGVSHGAGTSTNRIFTWPVTLLRGSNFMQAIGSKNGTNVTDSLFWFAPNPPPTVSITNPAVSIVYLNSTNDILQLSATAFDAQPNPPPLTTGWSRLSGPGLVAFGNTNTLATSAQFPVEGVYDVRCSANNGSLATADLTVVVNPVSILTNGLLAWWKMDESGGNTAFDASNNGRNATVDGAVFTSGYLSNALHFNGSTNDATFASPDSQQITIAAWAKADGHGNSQYPRILDTPGYRFYFRFDSQGTNGLDFATYSTGNGDWFSGDDTISTGAWYHVAVSYDRSNFGNVPALYVNGVRLNLSTISSPSGTQPPYNGTGYIGNKSDLSRAWSGSLDDLRIYNRILDDAEIRALASMPPGNLAPVVHAGANQIVVWPGPAILKGVISDDGQPNPPGSVSVRWSVVSGPGVVTFSQQSALSTSASFSASGSYVLRLTADDGQVRTSSDLTVVAIARPIISVQLISGALNLTWPSTGGVWQLQSQTNSLLSGLGSNWANVPGTVTSPLSIPLNASNASMFYRLVLVGAP